MGDGVTQMNSYEHINTASSDIIKNVIWHAVQFTTTEGAKKISEIKGVFASAFGNSDVNITGCIYTSSGSDPLTELVCKSLFSAPVVSGGSLLSFPFDTPTDVDKSTNYHVVWRGLGAGNADLIRHASSGGGAQKSTNSGTTWFSHADIDTRIFEIDSEADKISIATAKYNGVRKDNFIGFANEAITTASKGEVTIAGEATSLASISIGGNFYLADAYGLLSTNPGTFTRKALVGISSASGIITNIW